MKHIDELAELYALGALSDEDRALVEAHLAQCASCSARVGASEAVIASLVDAGVRAEPAPPELAAHIMRSATRRPARAVFASLRPLLGLAAALVLALGLSLLHVSRQNHDLRAGLDADEHAFAMLTHSHFRHAEFSKATAGAPAAKVLYARDGSWFYVVMDGAQHNLHVVGEAGGIAHDYGIAGVHGHTTTLFAENTKGTTRIELRDGTSVVGVAAPQY